MQDKWWKEALGYQIYIRSFKDENKDGIGDLKGIRSKLKYLKDLGVDFIWVCPFYSSPMDDNGYDVKDYYKIAKEYGSMSDLKCLIADAHDMGLKVVLDLVLNHTSTTNKWFKMSECGVEPYSDMYIWRDGVVKNGKLFPPNNWQSFFSGSAWEYSEKKKQFYLHIFSKTMPDLNYESESTFKEIEGVINYYASIGVDGFRVDAVAHIGKDLKFRNGKKNKTYKSFSNKPKAHEYLKRLSEIFESKGLVTIGEMGGEPTKSDLLKYTDKELNMVCSFEQMSVFEDDEVINVKKLLKTLKYKNALSDWGGWSALFYLNHDYPRLISKVGNEKDPQNASLCLATLMYMLRGTPIIYNGEELGMTNYPFASPKDFKDVNAKMIFDNAKNVDKEFENLRKNSRDHARTVMQWSGDKYAGFSTVTPWTYVNKNYKKVNVERELKDDNSMLSNYKRLIMARKKNIDIITSGNFEFFCKRGMLGYTIDSVNSKLMIVANLSNVEKEFKACGKIVYSNMTIKADKIKPYQALILKR